MFGCTRFLRVCVLANGMLSPSCAQSDIDDLEAIDEGDGLGDEDAGDSVVRSGAPKTITFVVDFGQRLLILKYYSDAPNFWEVEGEVEFDRSFPLVLRFEPVTTTSTVDGTVVYSSNVEEPMDVDGDGSAVAIDGPCDIYLYPSAPQMGPTPTLVLKGVKPSTDHTEGQSEFVLPADPIELEP